MAAILAAILYLPGSAMAGSGDGRPAFDFYVLSLSWSPSHCAAEGGDANPLQCKSSRPYGFIVHGLWPQFEKGYPEFCASDEPDRVPERLARGYLDLMPSPGLIGHQWRKHGTCTGLGQQEYLDLVRRARERVAIPKEFSGLAQPLTMPPEAVEERFIRANPRLPTEGVAVTCDRRRLREVRICLTTDLRFRSCPEVDRNACNRREVLIPPVP